MKKRSAKQWARALVAVLDETPEGKRDGVMTGFVQLLEEAHLRSRWREIANALSLVWKERYGAGTIELTTTEPQKEVLEALEKKFPHTAVDERIDPECLGGAKVRIDDRVIDATLRAQLTDLKQQLLQTSL